MTVFEKEIVVQNRHGIHGRVAASLAQIAARHEVVLHIVHGNQRIDCSSILDVLSMAFVYGTRFTVRLEGEKKKTAKALAAVEKLFAAPGEK